MLDNGARICDNGSVAVRIGNRSTTGYEKWGKMKAQSYMSADSRLRRVGLDPIALAKGDLHPSPILHRREFFVWG